MIIATLFYPLEWRTAAVLSIAYAVLDPDMEMKWKVKYFSDAVRGGIVFG